MQRLEHSYGVQETARKPLFIKHTAPAAAKLHQSCPTLCDPIDSSPPGSPSLDSPGKSTEMGCHFLLQCMKVKSESEVAQLYPTLSDPIYGLQPTRLLYPWDFPGKNIGSMLPFLSPGDLPNPGRITVLLLLLSRFSCVRLCETP